jgi:hypothetical protein
MRCTVFSSAARMAVQNLSLLFYKRHDFRRGKKNDIVHKMCFDFLYNFVENISHSEN